MTASKAFRGRTHTCGKCGDRVVFALTVASERGRGGKWMPIDPQPDPKGRVAIRDSGRGVLYARSLAADETHDTTSEVLATSHFATCGKRFVSDVEAFLRTVADGGQAS